MVLSGQTLEKRRFDPSTGPILTKKRLMKFISLVLSCLNLAQLGGQFGLDPPIGPILAQLGGQFCACCRGNCTVLAPRIGSRERDPRLGANIKLLVFFFASFFEPWWRGLFENWPPPKGHKNGPDFQLYLTKARFLATSVERDESHFQSLKLTSKFGFGLDSFVNRDWKWSNKVQKRLEETHSDRGFLLNFETAQLTKNHPFSQ